MRSVLIISADPKASGEISARFEPLRWRVERVQGLRAARTSIGFRAPELLVLHHSVGPPHELLPALLRGRESERSPTLVIMGEGVSDPALPAGFVGRVLSEPLDRARFDLLVEEIVGDYEVLELEQVLAFAEETREVPAQSEGLPPLSGPAYIRSLSRALLVWESEIALIRSQRDRARDAFARLRHKAVGIEAERKRLREELHDLNEELSRLRARRTTAGVPELEDGLLREVLGIGEEDTQPEIEVAPLSQDVLDDLVSSDREQAALFGDEPLPRGLQAGTAPAASSSGRSGQEEGGGAGRLATIETELVEVREEADRAWAECDELTVRLGEAEDGTAAAAASRESAERARMEAEERLASEQRRGEELMAALAARDEDLRELGESIATLEIELDSAHARLAAMSQALDEERQRLTASRDESDSLRETLAQAMADGQRAAGEAAALRGELARLETSPLTAAPEGGASAAASGEPTKAGAGDTLAQLGEARKVAERWESKAARLKASLEVARAEAEAARQEAGQLRREIEVLRSKPVDSGSSGGLPPRRVVSVDDLPEERSPSPWLQIEEEAAEDELEAALREASTAVTAQPPPLPRRGMTRDEPIRVDIELPGAGRYPSAPVDVDSGELDRLRARVVSLEKERRQLLQGRGAQVAGGATPASGRARGESQDVLLDLRNQLAQLRLERDLARQQLSQARKGAESALVDNPAQERALASALSLTNTRLAELPGLRQSGALRQRAWQSQLNELGQQVSVLLRTVGKRPELQAAGVQPELLFQNMKRLATESVDVFGEREALLAREENVLNILKDRLGEAKPGARSAPSSDRQPPTEPMRRR